MGFLKRLVAWPGVLGRKAMDAIVQASDKRRVLLPPDALILAEHVSRDAIERQRAELRGTAPLTRVQRAKGLLAVVLLASIALYGVYSHAQEMIESTRAGHLGWVIFDVVVGLIVLTFVGVLWSLHVRRTRAHVAGTSRALRATGGASERDVILDWFDHYWNWPCPPDLFEDAYADVQGHRQGFPFLLVSEIVCSDSDDRTKYMNRTLFFLAGSAGRRALLDVPELFPWDMMAHAVITPAGLFAWYPHAILHGNRPPEVYERALDKLVEVARRHGVVPPVTPSPQQPSAQADQEG